MSVKVHIKKGDTVYAVSYTYLDVYKRQVRHVERESFSGEGIDGESPCRHAAHPFGFQNVCFGSLSRSAPYTVS